MDESKRWVPAMHGFVRDTPWTSPDIPGWVGLYPFKAWCLQTLPTIFDESMSYYELLCKLLHYIEGCLQDVQILGEEFVKLKEYVENYFNGLDIQQEVNNKLDQMVADGTIQNMINIAVGTQLRPTPFNNSGIIIVGDETIANAKTATGASFRIALLSFLNAKTASSISPDLAEAGAYLMAPDDKSYFSIISKWINSHSNYKENGTRTIFLWLSKRDMTYSQDAIAAALNRIGLLIAGGTRVYAIQTPFPNFSPTKDDAKFYNILKTQHSANVSLNNVEYIPIKDMPLYANASFYSDEAHTQLSTTGTEVLIYQMIDTFVHRYNFFSFGNQYCANENLTINIIPMQFGEEIFQCDVGIKWKASGPNSVNFPVNLWTLTGFYTYVTNTGNLFSIRLERGFLFLTRFGQYECNGDFILSCLSYSALKSYN